MEKLELNDIAGPIPPSPEFWSWSAILALGMMFGICVLSYRLLGRYQPSAEYLAYRAKLQSFHRMRRDFRRRKARQEKEATIEEIDQWIRILREMLVVIGVCEEGELSCEEWSDLFQKHLENPMGREWIDLVKKMEWLKFSPDPTGSAEMEEVLALVDHCAQEVEDVLKQISNRKREPWNRF